MPLIIEVLQNIMNYLFLLIHLYVQQAFFCCFIIRIYIKISLTHKCFIISNDVVVNIAVAINVAEVIQYIFHYYAGRQIFHGHI